MRTLIQNGTCVTASDTFAADLWIDNGKIAALVAPGTKLGNADRTIDAKGKYVIPGGIDAHTHLDMPFGGTNSIDDFESGTLAAAHGGTTTHRRLRHPEEGRLAARGARHLARQGRGQCARRLRFPHDRDRRAAAGARRDGRDGARGRHQLQAVHGVSGRAAARRSVDLPRHAARRRIGRAHLHARRDGAADRRARRARPRRRPHGADLSRADPARGRRGDGHGPRDRARRDGQGAGLHRAPVGAARARARHGGARSRPARLRRDLPAIPVPLAKTICAARTATSSRAPSTCARRRCDRSTTTIICGAAWPTTTCRSSRPTTARSA